MKRIFTTFAVASLAASAVAETEDTATTNLPPDPFGDLREVVAAPGYTVEVDRSRGTFQLDAADGKYQAGSHFGNWFWTAETNRRGNYYVGLLYQSSRSKLGVQVKVGSDSVLKGYAPRTNSLEKASPLVIGTAHFPSAGEHGVAMLTGDQSNVPDFQIKAISFSPAPELEPSGQSIDGSILLAAATATTYSETMHYEPEKSKDCLGYWTDPKDWAEWVFDVSSPGEFELVLHYGCAAGSEGSEVDVLVNDQKRSFTVGDTGGFQSWEALSLGSVSFESVGKHRLAILPRTKSGDAIMDVQKVVLTPKS